MDSFSLRVNEWEGLNFTFVLKKKKIHDLSGAFSTTDRWRTLFGVDAAKAESKGRRLGT